jgi:hypothetical protein
LVPWQLAQAAAMLRTCKASAQAQAEAVPTVTAANAFVQCFMFSPESMQTGVNSEWLAGVEIYLFVISYIFGY